MKLSLTLFVSALTMATAAKKNPFAPKVSRNNAKNKMNAKLMGKAKVVRKLEEQEEQEVDLTGYSLKFEKCQIVKQYPAEEGGNDKEGGSILETKRFILFRLCPSTSSSCSINYGEYIVDMETYLEAVLGYKQEVQEEYCDTCNECYEKAAEQAENEANGEDADEEEDEDAYKCQNVDTSSCYAECQNIENMEENGYMDASELTECVKLDYEDNYGNEYYAGAMCASSGSRIQIGVFSDEECSVYESDKEIENYMQNDNGYNMKISYHLLKQSYTEGAYIADCLMEDEEDQNNNDGDEEKEAEVNEVCQELYEAAGKCESSHGFEQGIYDYENYDNQVRNEELVCDYISTIKAGHYDVSGEIVVNGGRTTLGGGAATSGGQKFALTFFILGSVGLAGYVAMLHQQLTKGAKADLAQQGGAMA